MRIKTLLAALTAVGILAGVISAGNGNQNANQTQGRTVVAQPVLVPLTQVETDNILHMRQEEKLARDVYLTLGQLWDHSVFTNIAVSEQRHMDAVELLLIKYGLQDPVVDDTVGAFSDDGFSAMYADFVEQGTKSLLDALNVGVRIEELDVADLKKALEETEKGDIQWIFGRLLRASTNHLRAFTRNVDAGGNACTQQNCPRLGDGSGNPNGPACQGQGQGQGWGRGRGGRGPGNGYRNGSCTGAGSPQQNRDGTGQSDRQQKRDGSCQTEPSA